MTTKNENIGNDSNAVQHAPAPKETREERQARLAKEAEQLRLAELQKIQEAVGGDSVVSPVAIKAAEKIEEAAVAASLALQKEGENVQVEKIRAFIMKALGGKSPQEALAALAGFSLVIEASYEGQVVFDLALNQDGKKARFCNGLTKEEQKKKAASDDSDLLRMCYQGVGGALGTLGGGYIAARICAAMGWGGLAATMVPVVAGAVAGAGGAWLGGRAHDYFHG